MNTVTLTCAFCQQKFERSQHEHSKNGKRGNKHSFCSPTCFRKARAKPDGKCLNCDRTTKNPKFCSRSCSSTYNNKAQPKKKRSGICVECGTASLSDRKYCEQCWQKRILDYNTATLADLATACGSRNSYRSSIGVHARKTAKEHGKLEKCAVCGYSKHVECCHIKAVANFPPHAIIAVINDPKNLIGLCRNHHWELEHGLLDVPQ